MGCLNELSLYAEVAGASTHKIANSCRTEVPVSFWPLMKHLHLLSTDFDGTLVGFSSDGTCSGGFAEVLTEYRKNGGLWAINTGRGIQHAREGVARFRAPSPPDFLLTNEREVFRRCLSGEWENHGEWNRLCESRHEELFEQSKSLLVEIQELMGFHEGSQIIHENSLPVGLITATEEQMERVAGELLAITKTVPNFSFQRNTIYLRFCHSDYDKGTALSELCRLEGILKDHVFCAGDHLNDLPMLTLQHAAMLACPSNAIPAVQEAVREAGGHVASLRYADGVAEGILHHGGRAASLS